MNSNSLRNLFELEEFMEGTEPLAISELYQPVPETGVDQRTLYWKISRCRMEPAQKPETRQE